MRLLIVLTLIGLSHASPRPTQLWRYNNDNTLQALQAPSQGASQDEFGVTGKDGAVATEVDVCSNIGAGLLLKGGSAADAVSSQMFFSCG
jgi:gamma-glutamyltranspeptidase/glutathione hydrolase